MSGGFFENTGEALGRAVGAGAGGIVGADAGLIAGGFSGGIVGLPTGPGIAITVPAGAVTGGIIGAGVGGKVVGDFGAQTGKEFGRYLDRKYDEWTRANNKADKVGSSDQSKCTGSCLANEKVDDLEKRANVKQETKGRTRHGRLLGDMSDAEREFDKLEPTDVKPISTQYGPGRAGTLDDGSKVVVRPGNSGNPAEPSLDIQRPSGRNTEIRFGA